MVCARAAAERKADLPAAPRAPRAPERNYFSGSLTVSTRCLRESRLTGQSSHFCGIYQQKCWMLTENASPHRQSAQTHAFQTAHLTGSRTAQLNSGNGSFLRPLCRIMCPGHFPRVKAGPSKRSGASSPPGCRPQSHPESVRHRAGCLQIHLFPAFADQPPGRRHGQSARRLNTPWGRRYPGPARCRVARENSSACDEIPSLE